MAAFTHKGVSHTLRASLVARLTRLAYHAEVSRSAIVEHAVETLFNGHPKDKTLIETLKSTGAGLRRSRRG